MHRYYCAVCNLVPRVSLSLNDNEDPGNEVVQSGTHCSGNLTYLMLLKIYAECPTKSTKQKVPK